MRATKRCVLNHNPVAREGGEPRVTVVVVVECELISSVLVVLEIVLFSDHGICH